METQTDFRRPPELPKDENGNYIRPQRGEFRGRPNSDSNAKRPETPKDENGNYIRPQGSEFREHLPINSTDSENSN